MAGDKDGWKRGECGFGGGGMGDLKLRTVKDYSERGISQASFGEPMKKGADQAMVDAIMDNKNWRLGPVGKGKGRDFEDHTYDTKSPKAASDKGKYASKGISKFISR